jgi:hypothetical protein
MASCGTEPKIAAGRAGGRFSGALVATLFLQIRALRQNALPFTVWHLHVGIGPTRVVVHGFALRVRSFRLKHHGGDRGLPNYRDMKILDIDACKLDAFASARNFARLLIVPWRRPSF